MTSTLAKTNLLRVASGILALAILAIVAQHAVQNEGSTALDELDSESEQLLRKLRSDPAPTRASL